MNASVIPDAKPVIVFKIATVPDVAGVRLLHGLPAALADNEVVEFVYQKGRAQADVSNAPDVLSLHLHRIVSIACAVHDGQQFRVVSLAREDNDEAALIERFCDLVARESVQLVSWNGSRFDLPVLQYRGLVQGISALSLFNQSTSLERAMAPASDARIPLHELAQLCGFPRVSRLAGNQIWHAWNSGSANEIHARCEVDVVICHLIFLRLQMLRGALNAAQYANELQRVKDVLAALDAQPWRELLADWPS